MTTDLAEHVTAIETLSTTLSPLVFGYRAAVWAFEVTDKESRNSKRPTHAKMSNEYNRGKKDAYVEAVRIYFSLTTYSEAEDLLEAASQNLKVTA